MQFISTISERFRSRRILHEILRHEGCCPLEEFLLPSDIDRNLLLPFSDHTSERKFFQGYGDKTPAEIVSAADKSAIRDNVIRAARQWRFRQGKPYWHVWYYPEKFRTLATFRVDCDSSDHASILNLFDHASGFGLPLTWFLHVEAQESFLSEIKPLEQAGHEIQLHCYRHETYDNYRENLENIRKGRGLMKANGFEPTGFVAPFGKWNLPLNRVLEKFNFSYSSEFAAGYDDFPFYPFTGYGISNVLQLPIHPICIGSLRKSGHSPEEMVHYFQGIIQQKLKHRKPIMLYGHPYREIDHYGEVIREVFKMLTQLESTWITTYSEYAAWWKRRISARYKVIDHPEGITIETKNKDTHLTLRVEKSDGTEYFFPMISGFYPYSKS